MDDRRKAGELLSKMTVEEKVSQMYFSGIRTLEDILGNRGFSAENADRLLKGAGIGGIQVRKGLGPEKLAEAVNAFQEYHVKQTRLGIPAIIFAETLHGVMVDKATVFPQAIGLAGTWNTELIGRIASMISDEARSVGIRQGLAPDLDLARDPRWGRVEETYGEDPFLAAETGKAYVRGLQKNKKDGIAATLKHYTAHGSPEGGLNLAPVPCGERQLRELYLVPFKACVEAGALSVMAAYSEYDGIPCHASRFLLNDILRNEFGFRGFTFCDFGALDMLITLHRTAADAAEAAKQALEAGMDIEAPSVSVYGPNLVQMAKEGIIPQLLIDRAVMRILEVKFELGLFDDPYVDVNKISCVMNSSLHKEAALQAGRESLVLLKNEGMLPLRKDIGRIAVIGPNAARAELGDYSVEKNDAVSPLEGITGKTGKLTEVRYAKGCSVCSGTDEELEEAYRTASGSDAVILFLGGSSMMDYGIGWGRDTGKILTCGEGFDSADIRLPDIQHRLAARVLEAGRPTLIVFIEGRPLAISEMVQSADAAIYAWYPGEEGGNAIADVIFGDFCPSGRLPVSFPKSAGHIPSFYNHKPSARGYYKKPGAVGDPGRDYVFTDPAPLFEFGYGLSYTRFEYSRLTVSPETTGPEEEVRVTVDVRNSGGIEAMEVVQLYLRDEVSSVTTPVKALKGFKKITLKPGEQETVVFTLGPESLSVIDRGMKKKVEPGRFMVMAGGLKEYFNVI